MAAVMPITWRSKERLPGLCHKLPTNRELANRKPSWGKALTILTSWQSVLNKAALSAICTPSSPQEQPRALPMLGVMAEEELEVILVSSG